MAKHIKTGQKGEELALAWFTLNKYVVLHKNWRYKNWEIDIVAIKYNILHFIEVKTRTSSSFGNPEDNVDRKKIAYMIDAADEYRQLYPKWQRIQFDIMAITVTNNEVEYFFIEDVYL